ncbi:DJ-1/PfpI family protein [Colletotrichum sojae]|uniref:DJ-1/PfpI family protein n=1 Tax=Colletotrichum sojae TaxID=2175907 RepID=A0A8H6J6F7_9PEZI|nr:DJ-1/PfpI family protein [Colletotrichum sojae]
MSQRRDLTLSIIAHEVGPVPTRSPPSGAYPDNQPKALEAHVMATHNFANAPPLDILLVPGGSGNGALERENDTTIADFIAARYQELKFLLSVCTGAKHLAISGVLDGRRATTNKASWNIVVKHGRNVSWVPTARWTQDGNIWTSSGVSAGMDMTYAFLNQLYGEEQADSVMNGMEYAPHVDPDWDPFSIVWKVSSEETPAAARVHSHECLAYMS